VADGRIFEEVPDYKALFSKADKALYSTKKNGKAHWEIYNENIVYDNSSHAIDYEAEDAENSTELFKTRDMMKVFLELSSSAKNSDDAMYKIIRYVAEKFGIDWFQIMKVNTKEDLITISYEWCSDPKFQNNAGKRGYYAHSDIKHFKEFFEKYPVFILSNEKINGFSLKFQREFEKNKKLIGWLKIDDTIIDYPVMQTSDNKYYLEHNFNQEYDKNGSLFLDCSCSVYPRSTNLIIYGHHMKSGQMFGQLQKYAKESYYEKHKEIQFDTIYEKGTYEIMYVFRSQVYNEDDLVFKYYQFINANSGTEFQSYMEEMKKLSLYDTGVTAGFGDSLLTLSTCDNSQKDGRFVVVAKKIL